MEIVPNGTRKRPSFSVSDVEGIWEKWEGISRGFRSYERNFKGDLEKKCTDLVKSNAFSRELAEVTII